MIRFIFYLPFTMLIGLPVAIIFLIINIKTIYDYAKDFENMPDIVELKLFVEGTLLPQIARLKPPKFLKIIINLLLWYSIYNYYTI